MATLDTDLFQSAAAPDTSTRDGGEAWSTLRFFNLYRLLIAALFMLVANSSDSLPPLGQSDPLLFYWLSAAWAAFGLFTSFTIARRLLRFSIQVYLQVGVDILAITLLMHASGGIDSGLGMLMLVSIAAAAILRAGRMAGLFAALASLAVLLEQLYSHAAGYADYAGYPRAGMLGITFFATAILAHVLARQIRDSEALAAQRGVDLAEMAELTSYVIRRMQVGVLVVDASGELRLMNGAARELLKKPETGQQTLRELSPMLAAMLAKWHGNAQGQPVRAGDGREMMVRFVSIGQPRSGVLVFLENAVATARQAQQLKLAAIGRLSTSIAHEVRNPLGAIAHAGQLLAESPQLASTDRRLTEIILVQSQRVNQVIESVLQLGRGDPARPATLQLKPWLQQFAEELVQPGGHPATDVRIEAAEQLQVYFDPDHLVRILSNLTGNGLRHSEGSQRLPRLTLHAELDESGRTYLEVRDTGPGIAEEHLNKLFEPFFTTAASGTGLGLYLSRELAQCNNAQLDYLPGMGGGCFRLTFGEAEKHNG